MKTAEDIVKDKQFEIISISHDQTVQKACQLMVEKKIGAILVKKEDKYVGIWTERDLMCNITAPGFNPQTARLGDYMTTGLHTVPHDAPLHKVEDLFLGLFLRHLPVEKEGKFIGLISIGDILRANLLEKEEKFNELNSLVNWEYYENWKWGRKKR
jgi:signal-transduction protein with cAMP-binding, CBS, and nucleotidyltransferase domain